MNFEQVYEEFKEYSEKRYKKQGFDNLTYDFNSHILPYFKDWDIKEMTKLDFIKWQSEILKKDYSNSYNKKLYSVFRRFLNYCCDYYELPINIAKEVGCFKKKFEEDKRDFYTLKEFKQFIKYVDNNVYKQYFNLMFFTGTRPSEAMALKFSDLKDDYISITKSIQRRGKREIDTPKTISSIRNIKIDKKLKRDLLNLKKYYERIYNNYNYDYFIFGGIKPLAPTSIDRYKFKACKKANLRTISQHQFRHSHATLLMSLGIPINEIKRRLGHSKVSTTFDIYIRPDLTQEKRVYNTLNSLRFNFFNNLTYDFKKIISLLKQCD